MSVLLITLQALIGVPVNMKGKGVISMDCIMYTCDLASFYTLSHI